MNSDFFPAFSGGLPKKVGYLKQHQTYFTAQSWNGLRSFAHNVKVNNLMLTLDLRDAAYDLITEDMEPIYEPVRWRFQNENPGYTFGFNGRSLGWLVLYTQDERPRVGFNGQVLSPVTVRMTPPRGWDLLNRWPWGYSAWRHISVKDREYLLDNREQIDELFEVVRNFDQATQRVVNRFIRACRQRVNAHSTHPYRNYAETQEVFTTG